MTTTAKTLKVGSLGDRFAELSVLILTLIALALGWWLKTSVENRSLPFQGGGITAQTPNGWFVEKTGEHEILRVSDRTASGFATTYVVETQPVPADSQAGQFIGLLTLDRGNTLSGYRVLNQQEVLVGGRNAIQVEYVYVESAANLTHAVIPAVVHGLDYVFVEGGKAVIVGYRADQSNYETNLGRFNRFLVSVQF